MLNFLLYTLLLSAPRCPYKVFAKRVQSDAILIDGKLTEPSYTLGDNSFANFVQHSPNDGAQASESTRVYVFYTADALIIGIIAYDSGKITTRQARRDQQCESDWLAVYIDSYNDKNTGFMFSINPSGAIRDAYIYNDRSLDYDWDPIWYAKSYIFDRGWSSEIYIPWYAIRFNRCKSYKFGFQVRRYINRKDEVEEWVPIPHGASGFVSLFGNLAGIQNINVPEYIELLPYSFGKVEVSTLKTPSYSNNIGLYLKYMPNPNIVLDGMTNPDFGQVEPDPALINLTTYETYYPEKRPFFIERRNIFKTDLELFYSRRIGAKPLYYSIPSKYTILNLPEATTILGALKLTGKSHGVSFGAINTCAAQEYARVTDGDDTTNVLVEPLTNYLVLRSSKEFWGGTSNFGILSTSTLRRACHPVNTFGIDSKIRMSKNYSLSAQYAMSCKETVGYGYTFSFEKDGGRNLYYGIFGRLISPEFDINDMGFLRRNNYQGLCLYFNPCYESPRWIFNSIYTNVNVSIEQNYEGFTLDKQILVSPNLNFKNNWVLIPAVGYIFSAYDDRETCDDIPVRSPSNFWISWVIRSDSRKSLAAKSSTSYSHSTDGSANYYICPEWIIKPNEFIKFSFSPSYSQDRKASFWVTKIDTNYIYASLEGEELNLTTRMEIALTSKLTLQSYLQPFLASYNYFDYKKLVDPDKRAFAPYPVDDVFDFTQKSVRMNLVFRYEYRAGSTIYLVWNYNMFDCLNEYKFDRDEIQSLITSDGNHTLLLKINYLLPI